MTQSLRFTMHVSTDDLRRRYRDVRCQSAALAEPLPAEDQVIQSMSMASPTKWHLAHTTWFFETFVLRPHQRDYRAFDPRFESIFNSYYRGVGEPFDRHRRGTLGRPTVSTIEAYRRHVDQAMDRLLERPPKDDSLLGLIEVGLQHEQQHQELILTDIKHALATHPLRPAYLDTIERSDSPPHDAPSTPPPLEWIAFDEGLYDIGAEPREGFVFDNETPRHTQYLQAFELAHRPVSCDEFIAFIDAGGYQDPTWWLSEGWEVVQRQRWQAPLYWQRRDDRWVTMTFRGMTPVSPCAPVMHLSFFEADAYARWSGHRLPTEAEWEVAADHQHLDGGFLEDGQFRPRCTHDVRGQALFGDLWEWSASPYRPYPGFRPWSDTLGEYNGKFMCGQFVLRGGSFATPREHIRSTYRNFFPPQARWQFTGLRLARSSHHQPHSPTHPTN